MVVGPFRVFRLRHFVVSQGILQRAFTELREITQTWQNNVGSHAMQLCGSAGHPIKFLDSQLQRTVFIGMAAQQRSESADREDRLHGTFAKCVLVADDHCATIILECSCENLAGRRALPAGQND